MFLDSATGKTMGITVRYEPGQSRGLFQDNAKHSPAPRDNFPQFPEWIGTTSAPRWYKSPRPPVNTPTSFHPLRAYRTDSALDSQRVKRGRCIDGRSEERRVGKECR